MNVAGKSLYLACYFDNSNVHELNARCYLIRAFPNEVFSLRRWMEDNLFWTPVWRMMLWHSSERDKLRRIAERFTKAPDDLSELLLLFHEPSWLPDKESLKLNGKDHEHCKPLCMYLKDDDNEYAVFERQFAEEVAGTVRFMRVDGNFHYCRKDQNKINRTLAKTMGKLAE